MADVAVSVLHNVGNILNSIKTSVAVVEEKNHGLPIEDLAKALKLLEENQYPGNKSTFEAYRREIERLLQWSWLIAKKSILNLKRQDIQEYIEFCLKPPNSWIGTKRVARYIIRGGLKLLEKEINYER